MNAFRQLRAAHCTRSYTVLAPTEKKSFICRLQRAIYNQPLGINTTVSVRVTPSRREEPQTSAPWTMPSIRFHGWWRRVPAASLAGLRAQRLGPGPLPYTHACVDTTSLSGPYSCTASCPLRHNCIAMRNWRGPSTSARPPVSRAPPLTSAAAGSRQQELQISASPSTRIRIKCTTEDRNVLEMSQSLMVDALDIGEALRLREAAAHLGIRLRTPLVTLVAPVAPLVLRRAQRVRRYQRAKAPG
jgi:hypothetical protein